MKEAMTMQDNLNENPLEEKPETTENEENTAEETNTSEQAEASAEESSDSKQEETSAEEDRDSEQEEAPAEEESASETEETPAEEDSVSEKEEAPAEEDSASETEEAPAEEESASETEVVPAEKESTPEQTGKTWTGEPTYTYAKKEPEPEIPRWTPYEETYKTVSKPEKANKRWIIPLVIVLGIMVIGIIVGVAVGAGRLSALVNQSRPIVETPDTTEPDTDLYPTDPVISDGGSTVSDGSVLITDVSSVVEQTMPAVVSITSRALVDTGGFGDYWDFFFGGSSGNSSNREKEEVDASFGSGTIISQNEKELLILTSYHVVEDSSSLYVTFHDGKSVDGYIKSQSEADDIAIVAVPLSDISKSTMADITIAKLSATPAKVGEGAIVIGNALGYGMSVTSGIVSATNREISVDGRTLTVLQTDAAINSGNSGGCVLNRKGEVIGISEAKIIVSHVEGMCYAIQVSSNTELIQRLLNDNSNAEKRAEEETKNENNESQGAYLGIRGRDIDSNLANSYGRPQGVYVAGTVPGSGAEAAGLKEGDIIVGMDNVSFNTMAELQEQLSRHQPGDKVTLIVMRENNGDYNQEKVEVTLSEAIS